MSSDLIVRFPDRVSRRIYLGVAFVKIVSGAVIILGGRGGPWFVSTTGAVVLLVGIYIVVAWLWLIPRRNWPRLMSDQIVLPHATLPNTCIPLAAVRAVGLRYTTLFSRSGWQVYVWDDQKGGFRAVANTFAGSWRRPARPRQLDARAIDHCKPAVAARMIYDQVVLVQGTDGPLQLNQQDLLATQSRFVTAWWSPDGQMGYVNPREPSGNATTMRKNRPLTL